jgi:DtxR family Mn-dependent transcriptional regulator
VTVLSDVMEDYLKAIYALERKSGPPVATSAIAEHLSVTAPTVTSMVENLAERGLVEREKYRGVELTEEGEAVALEVLRHHRLLESYLAEHLDYDWAEVHDEADALEHHISEEFERRISDALDNPATDPHGDPIPSEDLERPPGDDTRPLSECNEADRVVVARVRDRAESELQYLAAAGIEPGTALTVLEVAPIGMVTVEIDDRRQSLPERIADTIRVRPVVDQAEKEASEGVSDV